MADKTVNATPTPTITEVDPVNGPQIEVVTPYISAADSFADVPVTLHDQLTDLCRNKFSDIIAAGHVTDKDMRNFRTTYVRDVIKGLHKQLVERVAAKTEKEARAFYKDLRARGISVCGAIRMSGYKPEDSVCGCPDCLKANAVKK